MTERAKTQRKEWIEKVDRGFLKVSVWLEWLSGEFVLTKVKRANGGDVILVRALFVVAWMCILMFFLGLCFESFTPDGTKLGAILTVVYAALYARFSQQWHYLANLYNSIKAAEVRTATQRKDKALNERIAQWKAGFIEDADTLHLANKAMIASIICAWTREDRVVYWFNELTNGGESRLRQIIASAQATCEHESSKWNLAPLRE